MHENKIDRFKHLSPDQMSVNLLDLLAIILLVAITHEKAAIVSASFSKDHSEDGHVAVIMF